MSQLVQQAPDASACVEQAWEIVRTTEQIVGVDDLRPARPMPETHAADAALSAAREALTRRLELTSVSRKFGDQAFMAALALRAEQTQVALKDALLRHQCLRVESAQNAINGIRNATSTATLVECIPTQVYRMGFSRVLFSRIQNGWWLTCSAFAGADQEMASKMVEVGLAHPRQLINPLPESEMVRRGSPILVVDPQTDPHVHPELVALTQTASYVAAPVFCWGKPIGLVHADRHTDASGVTEFDRDVLGMFAAGLGLAFERNLMAGRLRAMRRAAEEHLRLAGSLADDFTLDVIESAGPVLPQLDDLIDLDSAAWPASGDDDTRLLSELTSREAEVLRAIAAGKTNGQVAALLFVTEGTVKSHVKHILRKLGASNRTEAVVKYHRARQALT
jgi:DNA-binding CsgD family transcriptional regulator